MKKEKASLDPHQHHGGGRHHGSRAQTGAAWRCGCEQEQQPLSDTSPSKTGKHRELNSV